MRNSEPASPISSKGKCPEKLTFPSKRPRETKCGFSKERRSIGFIARYFRAQEEMGVAHTIADMSKVKFAGENNLRGFMNTWRKVCNGSKGTVPESLREEMFFEEIQKSEVMAVNVKHYLRMKAEGDRKANRAYLGGLVWAHLDREIAPIGRKKPTLWAWE